MCTNYKAEKRFKFFLGKSGLPKHFFSILESGVLPDYYKKPIRQMLDDYINQFCVCGGISDINKGLYIHGISGSGKTVLASYLAYRLMREKSLLLKRGCLFVNTSELIDLLRPGRFGGEELLQRALRIDVLILDDFGTNVLSEWVFERLYYLLNSRRDNNLPVIITANPSISDLSAALNAVNPVYAQRILTRVESTSKLLHV